MLFRIKHAGVLALMLMAAAPALAQGPGGGGPGGRGGFGGGRGGFGGFGGRGSAYSLLQNEAVQKELDLTAEQKESTAKLLEAYREASQPPRREGNREDFQNLSQEERRDRFAAFAKEAEERSAKVNAEFKPKFAEVLDDVQQERLQQIYWQSLRSRALRDPELAKALKLTPEQQTKISSLLDSANPAGFGQRGPGGNQGGNNEDRQAAREKLNAEVKAVLTEEQRNELPNLLGAEFDVSQLGGPGGNRGPGGERRPGGGERRPGGDRPQRSGDSI